MARKPPKRHRQAADCRSELENPLAINDTNSPALAPSPRASNKLEYCAPFGIVKLSTET